MKKIFIAFFALLVITSCSVKSSENQESNVIPEEERTPIQENYPDGPPTLTPDSERAPLPLN